MGAIIDERVGDWVASPPAVYFKFLNALNNPETSFEEFGHIISADPAMSARLLKVVNSPFNANP